MYILVPAKDNANGRPQPLLQEPHYGSRPQPYSKYIILAECVCCVVSCVRIFSTLATAGVYFLLEIEEIYLSPFGDIVSTYSFRTRSYERIKQYCVFF